MTAPNDQLAAAVRSWLADLDPGVRAEFLDGLDTTVGPRENASDADLGDAEPGDAYPANWKKN